MHKESVELVQDPKHVQEEQVDRSLPPPETSSPSTCFSSSSTSSALTSSPTLSTPTSSPTSPTLDQPTSSSPSTPASASASSSEGDDDPRSSSSSVEVVIIPNHADGERAPGMFKPPCVQADEQILARCASTFSTDSFADCCRICQQHGEEPLLDLGCHCRGELAKAHLSCIEQWFGNKGSNKCEICQHVAENVPAPPAQPAAHFWVWRLGINRGSRSRTQSQTETGSRRSRFHPLWAALLILIAGLLFDVLISIFLGASALPVNIIIGVLVVLGIGTAARLVVECWHERGLRRNIRRIENNIAHLQEEVHHGSAVQV